MNTTNTREAPTKTKPLSSRFATLLVIAGMLGGVLAYSPSLASTESNRVTSSQESTPQDPYNCDICRHIRSIDLEKTNIEEARKRLIKEQINTFLPNFEFDNLDFKEIEEEIFDDSTKPIEDLFRNEWGRLQNREYKGLFLYMFKQIVDSKNLNNGIKLALMILLMDPEAINDEESFRKRLNLIEKTLRGDNRDKSLLTEQHFFFLFYAMNNIIGTNITGLETIVHGIETAQTRQETANEKSDIKHLSAILNEIKSLHEHSLIYKGSTEHYKTISAERREKSEIQ